MICATTVEEPAKEGMKLDQAQTTKPTATAAVAALSVASRQNRAAMIEGRNCATPQNEMRPMGASALESRVKIEVEEAETQDQDDREAARVEQQAADALPAHCARGPA